METECYFVCVDEDGIVCLTVKKGATVTAENVAELTAVVHDLGAVYPADNLCDISARHTVTPEARAFAAGEEVSSTTRRLALLVTSPVAKMAGNVFLTVKRPPYETKLFTDVTEARDWLLDSRKLSV